MLSGAAPRRALRGAGTAGGPLLALLALAALLASLAVGGLGLAASGSVIVFLPANVSVSPVEPPVVLSPSNDVDYVDTGLGPAGASANVSIALPSGYVIGLESRAAVYWSGFDSDPLASGDLYVLNPDPACSWSWSPSGYLSVTATNTASSEGGECIVLVNRTAAVSPRVWVNYAFRIDQGSGYADVVLRQAPDASSPYYTVSAFEISDYDLLGQDYAEIYLYSGGSWSRLASTQVTIYRGYWYDMTAYRDDSTGEVSLYSGTSRVVSATDTSVDVGVVGVGVYYSADTFQVDFDYLLITLGASPYYVNVTGLQPGWYVRILDQDNNVLASATATSDTVSLDAWSWKFAPNATIEVYTDSTMSTLIARATFNWVVGGDLYRVSQPATGVTLNLANANNTLATTTFNISLRLESYTANNTVDNITIWIESPGAAGTSTPIQIIAGTPATTETSWVTLPPQYQARIYIHIQAPPATTATLQLTLRYTINNAVTVTYPITTTIQTTT